MGGKSRPPTPPPTPPGPRRPPPPPGGNVDAICPNCSRRGLAAGSAFGGMSLP